MSDQSQYRAVGLDAAGTLITVARPVGETYAEIAGDFGGDLDAADVLAGFREHFRTMPPLAFPGAADADLPALERGWWRDLVARVVERGGGVAQFDRYFATLYEHYARGGAWRTYPEVAGVLARLREAGLRLVVVSNFDSRLENVLRAHEVDAAVDAIVYSARAGAAKPDAAIFARAAEALGVPRSSMLHVGDSRVADLEGARGAGCGALLLDRRAGPADDEPWRIRDLEGVLAHLGLG